MQENERCDKDAAYIITVLREGLDYSRIGAAMIALLQLIENHCQAQRWYQANECCEDLKRLAGDKDMEAVPGISGTYALGIAQMCRGAIHLSQDNLSKAHLDSVVEFFSDGQRFFHEANVLHSEAVSLLALGIAYQRQYELGYAYPLEPHWSKTLKALQCSLSIFRNLGDRRYADVRTKLTEVQDLYETYLEKKMGPTPSVSKGQSPGTKARGRPIRIVGRIAAGKSSLAEEDVEGYIWVDDELAEHATFALRVQGDSMIEAAILDNDLVFIQKRDDPPPNGQIAAVMVEQVETEATLKRFHKEKDHIRLEPANESYPFILLIPDATQESTIRERYKKGHPERLLEIHAGAQPSITGWARAVIRREIKIP